MNVFKFITCDYCKWYLIFIDDDDILRLDAYKQYTKHVKHYHKIIYIMDWGVYSCPYKINVSADPIICNHCPFWLKFNEKSKFNYYDFVFIELIKHYRKEHNNEYNQDYIMSYCVKCDVYYGSILDKSHKNCFKNYISTIKEKIENNDNFFSM